MIKKLKNNNLIFISLFESNSFYFYIIQHKTILKTYIYSTFRLEMKIKYRLQVSNKEQIKKLKKYATK